MIRFIFEKMIKKTQFFKLNKKEVNLKYDAEKITESFLIEPEY